MPLDMHTTGVPTAICHPPFYPHPQRHMSQTKQSGECVRLLPTIHFHEAVSPRLLPFLSQSNHTHPKKLTFGLVCLFAAISVTNLLVISIPIPNASNGSLAPSIGLRLDPFPVLCNSLLTSFVCIALFQSSHLRLPSLLLLLLPLIYAIIFSSFPISYAFRDCTASSCLVGKRRCVA